MKTNVIILFVFRFSNLLFHGGEIFVGSDGEIAKIFTGAQAHYSQPWKFHIRGSGIDIFPDEDRWLKAADADQRELFISVGCALENLLVAAEHFGYAHQEEYFPQGEDSLVTLVKLTSQGKIENPRDPVLFDRIPKRYTNHNMYESKKIPKAEMDRLHACVFEKGCWMFSTNEGPYILFTEEELRRRRKDMPREDQ